MTRAFVGIVCGLLSLACVLVTSAEAQTGGLTGTWIAEDIGGGGVMDGAETSVTFEDDGSVSGKGGCNRFRGRADIQGLNIRVGPLGSTRMMCVPALMTQETKFLAALEAARSFKIDTAFLRMYDAAGAEVMRLTRKTR